MTDTASNIEESATISQEQVQVVKFCPICGTQMNQESPYGFPCWVCPECDYIEPI